MVTNVVEQQTASADDVAGYSFKTLETIYLITQPFIPKIGGSIYLWFIIIIIITKAKKAGIALSFKRLRYRLDGRGVGFTAPAGATLFSSPRRRDGFWGQPSLLSNGYRGLFLRG
jgi:hypothetical protein